MVNAITFIMTESCNMRCKYCFEQDYHYKNNYIDSKIIEKTLNMLFEQKLEKYEITLFGGEPTLNKDGILKVIDFLQDKSKEEIVIVMTTNLFKLDKELFNKLNELATKENITIDIGVSAILNEKYHDEDRIDINGKGTYKQIINNFKYCLTHFENINFSVHSVISKKNIKHITEIIDSSLEFKLQNPKVYKNSFALVSVSSLNNIEEEYTKEELKYYYEDYIKRDKGKYGICKHYIEDIYFPIIYSFDLLYNRELHICRAMKTELTVGTDGNITPCHRAELNVKQNNVKKISYGNIKDVNSIEEIENKIPFIENIQDGKVKFISELTGEDCKKCTFNNMCHSCIIATYNLTGSFKYKSKGECLRTMTMAELTMEYERIKMMKEIRNELENINNRLNSLGEITTINTEALVELLKQKENNK